MPKIIALVSCVKTKAPESRTARTLYTSPLFIFASAYAEKITNQWYVLSAKYGVVHPDQIISPYEKTLNKMPASERKAWAAEVLETLKDIVTLDDEIVFLAGVRYRQDLIRPLESWGCKVSIPMEGLTLGQQLRWLKMQLQHPDSRSIQSEKSQDHSNAKAHSFKFSGGSMSLADQIREYAINEYVNPARKAGRSTIEITARDVHADLGLSSRYPAVCSALDGDKFKEKAMVLLHSRTGPHQSSTVTWIFEIL